LPSAFIVWVQIDTLIQNKRSFETSNLRTERIGLLSSVHGKPSLIPGRVVSNVFFDQQRRYDGTLKVV
jgi:hypothetical protein